MNLMYKLKCRDNILVEDGTDRCNFYYYLTNNLEYFYLYYSNKMTLIRTNLVQDQHGLVSQNYMYSNS
jgi:hypothetical protein